MTNLIKSLILTNKSILAGWVSRTVWERVVVPTCVGLVSCCIVENNQYVLNVDQKLKKPEIKKLCQEIFNTQVLSVNTYNLPPKKRHAKMKRVFVKFAGPKGNNPLENFVKILPVNQPSGKNIGTDRKSTNLKGNNFPLETLK
nr:ribosomal protein L23 [Trentepohlia sp. YN1317]